MEQVVADDPHAALPGDRPRMTAHVVATHLLHLLHGAGVLNFHGHHSAAIALFRQLEDALDCLLAVALVPGAADRWWEGEIKPSDAAKLVQQSKSEPLRIAGEELTWGEYRRRLRRDFNPFSHCSRPLTQYNLALVPEGDAYEIRCNLPGTIIDTNAHQIDAFLVAHTLETLPAFMECFPAYFDAHSELADEAGAALKEMQELMERHMAHRCHEVWPPAELRGLRP